MSVINLKIVIIRGYFGKMTVCRTKKIKDTFRQVNLMYWDSCPHCYFHFFDQLTWEERLKLRKVLSSHLEKSANLGKDKEKLLIPGKQPLTDLASISISHCKILGGFIFSLKPNISIGLDIEQVVRVRPGLINRISQIEEVQQAPTDALLWVAKEASFKCIPLGNDSLFISHICISNWNLLQANAYSFCFQVKDYSGSGIAFIEQDIVIASAQMLKM